jgi:PAS domain S-box-containing protein
MLGYEKNELPDKIEELYSRVHADDLVQLKKNFDDCLSSKTNHFIFDFRLRCKNGSFKWIHSQGKIHTYNEIGKPERFIGTQIDITKQKVAEEKLNNEIHDLSFSNNVSQLGYWSLDLKTMVITGSRNTFSILGFNDTEQISLRQIEKIIHPDDQQTFISQFVVQTTHSSLENIFRIMVDNTTRYIILRSRPTKNQKNILIGFRGTFQDITSLKQNTVQLSDEKTFFNSIADNLQYSIQVIKEDTVLFSNFKTSELTGYTHKEIISKNISPIAYLVPEDRIQVKKMVDLILSNPTQPSKNEVRIETKNNRIKWVELTVSTIDTKDGNAILFQMLDVSKRKKLEHELLSSEKQLKAIVTSAPSSIALVSTEGQFLYTNETFHSISGFSSTEIKNKTFESLFNENDYASVSKGIEALTMSISNHLTFDFNQLGNNKAWVRLTIVPAKSSKNEIDYFIIYCDNIDLEKKRTISIEAENLLGRTIIDNAPTGYAIFNSKQELISCDKRFSEDFMPASKMKPKIYISEIEKLAAFQNQIIKYAINENSKFIIEINPTPEKHLQVEFIPVKIQNEKSILLYTNDITKSSLKNDSLAFELERFKGIYENAPIGILLVDKNRNIIISNHKFEKYFDFSTNELSFIKLDTLIDTQYLGECISKFSQLFAGVSSSFQQVLKMNSKSGENRWISANAASVKDNFGDSKYAIFIIEDITQLKNDEQGMLSTERLQTLNYIANNFAHEFNNLLMAIYGNAYLLNNNLKDTPLIRYTNNLINSTNRASDLTHKLLSFSEKSSNLNIVFSSDELLAEIINSVTFSEQIKLSKSFNNKNESLIGDPYQLKKAVQYIIENAIESMPKEGHLSVETNVVYFEPEGIEDNTMPKKGKYLRIIISDTGIGIAKNDLNKIFDPFYSTKPEGLNTGLGLSIAKQIIASHNGIIKAFSTKDKGTSINIYLPAKEASKTIAANQPDERLIVKGSAKILIVDDEEVVRLITSELLSELGYDVYSFASGKKALKFYNENFATIDLVLLDKQMPEMDGIEVYNNLKKINQFVKAIILTGYNIDNEIGILLKDSLSGYIQKPVSIEKLSSSISEVLFNRN